LDRRFFCFQISRNLHFYNPKISFSHLNTAKQKYQSFLSENYVPLFYRPYYLDFVCDGPWDVVIHEEDGEVLGVLVFMIKQKFGLTYILHPELCPYMGPLFFGSLDVEAVYKSLLDKLPNHQLLVQNHFHSIPEIRSSNGVNQKKYTYTVSEDVDLEILHSKLSSDRRRKIRKAGMQFDYLEEDDISRFIAFIEKSFVENGQPNPYANINLRKLDKSLSEHNCRKIVKCVDDQGNIMAMGYFVFDERWVYNLATGVNRAYPHEAMSLMMWNEISSALQSRKSFDFEGSAIPGVEAFYKGFKGEKIYIQSTYKSQNKIIDLLVRLKNPEILPR